jgi:hypothetical protein
MTQPVIIHTKPCLAFFYFFTLNSYQKIFVVQKFDAFISIRYMQLLVFVWLPAR